MFFTICWRTFLTTPTNFEWKSGGCRNDEYLSTFSDLVGIFCNSLKKCPLCICCDAWAPNLKDAAEFFCSLTYLFYSTLPYLRKPWPRFTDTVVSAFSYFSCMALYRVGVCLSLLDDSHLLSSLPTLIANWSLIFQVYHAIQLLPLPVHLHFVCRLNLVG